VELGLGKESFCFLGCTFRVVRSHFTGKRYLYRWPSPQAMKSLRARIRALTDHRRRAGMRDIREVIEDFNPLLRGWGNYFRTGNASQKFQQIDRYVAERLVRLGRRADTETGSVGRSISGSGPTPASSRSTASTRYLAPFATLELRMRLAKTIGQPCAGNPYARLERGPQETEPARHRA
jgi:hypothetical protein